MIERLKASLNNPVALEQILNEILNIGNQEKMDETIREVIPILYGKCLFNLKATNVVVINFINNYYARYNNVTPFHHELFSKVIGNYTSNFPAYPLKDVDPDIVNSKWFFELIKPVKQKEVSISEFQFLLDNIYQQTGVLLQEKASKFYHNFRQVISPYVDKVIDIQRKQEEELDDNAKKKYRSFQTALLTGGNHLSYYEYSFVDLDENQNKKLQELEKNSEANLLLIKLYNDLVIGELFETTPNVVYMDMKEMLFFNKKLPDDEQFLSTDIVMDNMSITDIYNKIILMGKMKSTEQIEEFYQKLKNINIKERFYDDMLLARRKSESLIRNKLYQFSDADLCQDLGLAEQFPDIKIFDLRDENKKYNLLVRHLGQFKEDMGKDHRYDCYSYINDKNNHTHFSGGENYGYNYGYYNFNPDSVVFLSVFDSYTNPKDKEITSREKSILADGNHSLEEINLVNEASENGYVPKKPDYIIAYKEIDQQIYEESLRLGIPVLLLNPVVKEDEYQPFFYTSSAHYHKTPSIDSSTLQDQTGIQL